MVTISVFGSSYLLQVCELVKFMIEHCQQILGEDPSSLFGGPPQRLNTDETGSGTETTEISRMFEVRTASSF